MLARLSIGSRCPFDNCSSLIHLGENIWPHLLGTVLPGYVWRTLGLLAGVGS
jgi:hypothetical protein